MSFRHQPWDARFQAMGDEAEAVYEDAFAGKFTRFGLNRPPFQVGRLPLKQRYAPDYLESEAYVEVMGFGRDLVAKWKIEKIHALSMWDHDLPVDVFVFDGRNDRWCRASLSDWLPLLFEYGEFDVFPEGKPYVGIRTKHIPFSWTKVSETVNPGVDSTETAADSKVPNVPNRRRHRPAPQRLRRN